VPKLDRYPRIVVQASSLHPQHEHPNPKSEGRNPKEIRNPKSEMRSRVAGPSDFGLRGLGFRSGATRPSDFGFCPMNTPAQSPARELVRSPCREWAGAPLGNVVEAGNSLSFGTGGVGAAEAAAAALDGVNALDWPQAVNKSAPNYDYDLTVPDPYVYGTDSYGSTPAGGYNYWPGGVAGGGVAGTPGANSMMWLFTQPGCVGNFPNTPGDTANPQQYRFLFCQASWWVYLKGWLSQTWDPAGSGSYLSMTCAYRGRYQLDRYRTGFRATCELWAFNSSAAFGWDDYLLGAAAGVPDYYIGVMPRNVSLVAPIAAGPGVYREVPIPTATTGSGSLADGFLGLASFEIWGISWPAWQAATGL
jgi:hypothetical protein